jgi:hypothetical protein
MQHNSMRKSQTALLLLELNTCPPACRLQGWKHAHAGACAAASALLHLGRLLPVTGGAYSYNHALSVFLSALEQQSEVAGMDALTASHAALCDVIALLPPDTIDLGAGVLVDAFPNAAVRDEKVSAFKVPGPGTRALYQHFCTTGVLDAVMSGCGIPWDQLLSVHGSLAAPDAESSSAAQPGALAAASSVSALSSEPSSASQLHTQLPAHTDAPASWLATSSEGATSARSSRHECFLQPHVALSAIRTLEDMLQANASVLLVGPAMCGKSTAWQLLLAALNHSLHSAGPSRLTAEVSADHVRSPGKCSSLKKAC